MRKNTLVKFLSFHNGKIILAIFMMIYSGVFSYFSLIRHWSLGTYYYDLGIMHQTIFNSSRGHLLELTDPNTTAQISRFAIHFDPLMLILAPLYWIYPHAEMLLIGQTLFLASGAVPMYLLAKYVFRKIKNISSEFIGLFFAFLYLNYFPLQETNLFDFHSVVLVTPLLIWAMYFIETGKYKYCIVFLVLSIFGKENITLITFMIGLYLFFFKNQKKLGTGIAICSIAIFLLVVGVIIPSQRSNLHFAESYYSTNIATNIQRLISPDRLTYIVSLLQPLGFLSLFSPLFLLIALPEWMLNLLSKSSNMRALQYHYTALLTPFILLATLFGLYNFYMLIQKILSTINPRKIIFIICSLLLLINIYTSFKVDVLPVSTHINKKKLDVVQSLSQKLSDSTIPLSATGHMAPYFAGRQYFYNFLFDFAYGNMNLTKKDMEKSVDRYEKADYVVIQRAEVTDKIPLVDFYYAHLKNNPKYELVFNKEGIEVYHKIGTDQIPL